MSKGNVVVGMSGGVDSSVCAHLLKEEGYHVTGVTMQIWQDESVQTQCSKGGCCGLSAVDDARRVAFDLDIPYYVMNFKKEFQKEVIDYFVQEYLDGRTPNPCIACNRYVKWESLLHRSLEIGADYIATGHYARVLQLENGRYTLEKSVTAQKDQTYALYNLTQEQLRRTLMPVGAYTKEEIREIAQKIGLEVASKPDSQEICFVPDQDYADFIRKEMNGNVPKEGNFVTKDGIILGKHKGIFHYTIGQRKGLNLSIGKPAYVMEIRPHSNEVVIGSAEDVFDIGLIATHTNWMTIDQITDNIRCVAKVRYNHQGSPCEIIKLDDQRIKVIFDEPQRAITPGQAVVFYDGNYVLGGGVIMEGIK